MNEQEQLLEKVKESFKHYCYYVNNYGRDTSKEGYLWYPGKFHTFVCDTVQEFVESVSGRAYDILILTVPPQHGKSTTVTETLPSWYLGRYPDKSVISISYGDDLAQRFGRANLDKVQNFGNIFGIRVDKKKANPKQFKIAGRKGTMISAGITSGITGNRADLIVLDDPIKNREIADSPVQREKIWGEFFNTVSTRLSAGGKVVIILTRWHEDDIAGRILADEGMAERTTLINLPCEAEENDLLGREVGEPLCPEPEGLNKGKEWLADFKKAYASEQGVRAWNALFQGRPTSEEGNMLKREWWQYYDSKQYEDGDLKFDKMIMSVDATFKDQNKNDYVAIGVWGKAGNRIYLIDAIKEHLNFPDTLRKIKVTKARYPQIADILIEDKANGSGIIQILRNEIMGVIPVTPDASKEARVQEVSYVIEAGNVYLPNDKRITFDFIEECAAFPNGKHDDLVDMMSQAISRLIYARTRRKLKRSLNMGGWGSGKRHKSSTQLAGRGERTNVI